MQDSDYTEGQRVEGSAGAFKDARDAEVNGGNAALDAQESLTPFFWYRNGKATPMVPCDDAAIERVARELRYWTGPNTPHRELAEAVLRAAGEVS